MRHPLDLLRTLVLIVVGLTLPLEYSRVELAGFPLTPNKVAAAALLGFVALQWALERRPARRDVKRLWVLFLAGAIAIGAVHSILRGLPAGAVLAILATWYTLILFYFMLILTLDSRRSVELLYVAFILGSILAAVSGWLGIGAEVESVKYGERLSGEGGNPNLLAFNLIVGIAATVSFYFTARRAWVKMLCAVGIVLMVAGVFGSLSRTAYLTLFIAAGFWAIRFRRVDFIKYAAPFLIVVVLAFALAPERYSERLFSLTPEGIAEDRSAASRFKNLPSIFTAIVRNPIIGVGLGGFPSWAEEKGYYAKQVHNAFLQVFVDHGVAGGVPFAAIFLLCWAEFVRASRIGRRLRHLHDRELAILRMRAMMLEVAMLSAFVISQSQPSMRHKGLWMLFATSTAILGLARARARELVPEPEPAWHPGLAYERAPAPSDASGG